MILLPFAQSSKLLWLNIFFGKAMASLFRGLPYLHFWCYKSMKIEKE